MRRARKVKLAAVNAADSTAPAGLIGMPALLTATTALVALASSASVPATPALPCCKATIANYNSCTCNYDANDNS